MFSNNTKLAFIRYVCLHWMLDQDQSDIRLDLAQIRHQHIHTRYVTILVSEVSHQCLEILLKIERFVIFLKNTLILHSRNLLSRRCWNRLMLGKCKPLVKIILRVIQVEYFQSDWILSTSVEIRSNSTWFDYWKLRPGNVAILPSIG